MTRKLIFKALVLILYSVQVFSQDIPKIIDTSPIHSYDSKIPFWIKVKGGNISAVSKFQYSINDGKYIDLVAKNADKYDASTGVLILNIDTLSLSQDSNRFQLMYKYMPDSSFFITYAKPKVNLLSIVQNGKSIQPTNGIYVVKNDSVVTVNLDGITDNLVDPTGTPEILGVQSYAGNNLWTDIAKTQGGNTGSVTIETLTPGAKYFSYRAKGRSNFSQSTFDYSDTLKVCIFYIDFKLPKEFSSKGEIWKKDTLIDLYGQGQPKGGWFTGIGIVDNSNYFNSINSNSGLGNIKYNFPYGGVVLTDKKPIQVLFYDFEISGPLSVCQNSSDVEYEIKNSSSDFTYTWAITNGTPESINSSLANKVTWNRDLPDGQHFGEVSVTATHKTTGAIFIRKISVFINNNVAYNKPDLFFGDQDQKLVICSITDAYSYKWYVDGAKVDSSATPFHYFKDPGKIYAVELITPEGTITRQEIYRSVAVGVSGSVRGNSKEELNTGSLPTSMLIYPNITNNEINVIFVKTETTSRIRVFNSALQLQFETQIGLGNTSSKINISNYPPGKYIIQLINSSGSQSDQFIKIN